MKIISQDNIEKLKEFNSATISNAIEFFKVRSNTIGYASMELKCLVPVQKPMIGYAITVTVDTTTPGPIPGRFKKLEELLDIVDNSPKPSVIVMKCSGPDRFKSCCVGDMFAVTLQKIGSVGIITDCGVRDLEGIKKRAAEFGIFSPGVVVSHGYGNFINLGTEVSVCGLLIKPGDLLHGDENGVVSIPVELIDINNLIDRSMAVLEEEEKVFDYLNGNKITIEEIKKRLVLQEN